MKLSKAQKEVIEKMRNGAELDYEYPKNSVDAVFHFKSPLARVRFKTMVHLQWCGLVTKQDGYVMLTELGKTIELK